MYIQFLTEDRSTEILIGHVMEKIQNKYSDREIHFDSKSFKGIGHLPKHGTPLERKTGQLLNDLPLYLRAFDRKFRSMTNTVIIVVLDNDKREPEEFLTQLNKIAQQNMLLTDHAFCVAVKEMEAWLLGDIDAIETAYPNVRKSAGKDYIQDELGDTWEVLANMIYPGGLKKLKRRAVNSYSEIGRMKSEWADQIGKVLDLKRNISPSFQNFIYELTKRIEIV